MEIEGAIFDMDGVVTDTAKAHCHAWKETFDAFLKSYTEKNKLPFHEFTEQDYLSYVDGMPRFDGIRSFLKSRHITLPNGTPDDDENQETVYGLGLRKNRQFVKTLDEDGVVVFESTVQLIKNLQAQGTKIAIVSSSKNCQTILAKGNVEDLFEVRIDGTSLDTFGLKGKPHPDIFLEAAKQLNVKTEHSIVIEDALSGVQAGKAGGFGFVIGIDRKGSMSETLKEGGADVVVRDLKEITRTEINDWFVPPKHLLENLDAIKKQLHNKKIAIFLDYDGTLTPIVARPDLAVLSSEMRNCLKEISQHYTTAIISGRQLKDVYALVDINSLYYAGNHGFEIEGPEHTHIKQTFGTEFLSVLKKVHREIKEKIENIPGLLIEDKKYSLSVHYRLVDENEIEKIETIVDHVLKKNPTLQKHHGKKVFEIRPRMNWDKGKAVLHVLKTLKLDTPDVFPIYIGDDVTDEDAFRTLKNRGIGILVTDTDQLSRADYLLKDVVEVKTFLETLINIKGTP